MTHQKRLGRGLVAALLCLFALVLATAAADRADAFANWSCPGYVAAQTCWAGTGYQNYHTVVNELYVDRYEVCAKGYTAAGNYRLGGGNGCAYNTHYRISCFGSTSPNTAPYGYWAGSGQATTDLGSAWQGGEATPPGYC